LTADLNLARSMGEAGRQTAAHFSWDHVAAQMEDLYTSFKNRTVS
jgi:glycosyltransferase involved in cell wall biosynthesis